MTPVRRLSVASLILLVSVATLDPATATETTQDAKGTVAFLDTGIDPYHRTFRDSSPRAYQHPSTYLPGYPVDAIALPITLDEDDYWTAVRADCEDVWSRVEPGTLYWFPGTKVIAAISFVDPRTVDCSEQNPHPVILDAHGHGTMVTSRGTSREYGACRACLAASVQILDTRDTFDLRAGDTGQVSDALRWTASNADWIDAQSNSWGPVLPVYDPTGVGGLYTASGELVRTIEETSSAHAAFWAAGNGALFRLGVLGHPTTVVPTLTPSMIMVGGLDSGHMTAWTGFPAHVVSDACSSWAARARSTDSSGDTVGGGTSAATPFAAGESVRVLIEARTILSDTSAGVRGGVVASGPAGLVPSGPIADGVLTLDEWKATVFKTASPRPVRQYEDGAVCNGINNAFNPALPLAWKDVPDGYPEYLQIGYGALDQQSFERAAAVLRGTAPLPDRTETDRYFALDRRVREITYTIFGR